MELVISIATFSNDVWWQDDTNDDGCDNRWVVLVLVLVLDVGCWMVLVLVLHLASFVYF